MSTRDLKTKCKLETIIGEAGYSLEQAEGRYRACVSDAGLVVDVEKQRYTWAAKSESGDVLTWLMARYGWSFPMAKRFLEYRAGLPDEQRAELARLPEVKHEGGRGVIQGGLSPETRDDWRIQKAFYLALDFPGGIEPWINRTIESLCLELVWIPVLFTTLTGDVGEGCSWCGKEIFGNSFVPVDLGGNYELTEGNGQMAGVFCQECVSMFSRWKQAEKLIIRYLNGKGGQERSGGAGGKHDV